MYKICNFKPLDYSFTFRLTLNFGKKVEKSILLGTIPSAERQKIFCENFWKVSQKEKGAVFVLKYF
jgi:hypothetical protein